MNTGTLDRITWSRHANGFTWVIPTPPPPRVLIPLAEVHRMDAADYGLVTMSDAGELVTYRVLDVCGVNNMTLLCELADHPRTTHLT